MRATDRSTLASLPEETKQQLFSMGTACTAAKGETLFDELTEMTDILFLLEGFVSLYRSSYQGESRVIFICPAGEVLNEVSLENPKTSVAARALSDIVYLRVPREQVSALMLRDAAFGQAMFRSLVQKTRRLYHKVGNATGTYTLKNRMAAAIWKLTRNYSTRTALGYTVDFEVTVNFLSTLMGAKRETVSRALSEMKKSGLILHENGTLTVPDLQKLRESFTVSD